MTMHVAWPMELCIHANLFVCSQLHDETNVNYFFTVQLPFKLYHVVRTKTASHPSKSGTFSFVLFYCSVFYFISFYFVLLCFGFLVYFFLGHFFLMYSTLVNTVVLNVLYKST